MSALISHNALDLTLLHSAAHTYGAFTRNLSVPTIEAIEIVIFLGGASAHDANFILNQSNIHSSMRNRQCSPFC